MEFQFNLRELPTGEIELRFPEINCARGIFKSVDQARDHAFMVFVQAAQSYFEERKPIPIPTEKRDREDFISIGGDYAKILLEHNSRVL